MRIEQLIADFSRLKRYAITMFRHLTLRRCINLCLLEGELILRRSQPKGYPYQLIIDPNNICQLKCPLCSTGLKKSGRPRGEMSFELFKKAIDELGRFGLHLFLHNWGEPLLHKDIFKFISYADEANLGTTLSSNLSFPLSEEMAERLISSGLETLVVSLDGVSRSTYERYRVGGDFGQVISNVRLLAKKKKKMGKKLPLLEWQFLMMKHNEDQIKEARRRYRELGFDSIFFPKINLPHNENDPLLAEDWLPIDKKRRPSYSYDKADNIPSCCWWLWRTTVINYDGGVSPCCYIDDKNTDFGNITHDSFRNIWSGRLYRSARSLFSSNDSKAKDQTICGSCNVLRRWREEKYAK